MKLRTIIWIIFIGLVLAAIPTSCSRAGDNAGISKEVKQIVLEEVLRITGEDERYYFKQPLNLKVDRAGNIYILDVDEFLQFDAQGKFVHNYFKKGEGPGEVLGISGYILQPDRILIHSPYPNKMVEIDYTGKPITEYLIVITANLTLFHATKDRLYFDKFDVENTAGEGKLVNMNHHLLAYDKLEKTRQEFFNFPVKSYLMTSPEISFYVLLNYFKYTPKKGPLFFTCNTDEYEVKLIDLEKMKIVKTIKRGYERVKVTKETEPFTTSATLPSKDGGIISTPKQEFLHDIQAIYFYDNMLWVFTSTVDKEKGVMIDLYDEAGKFMRSLYMKFPQWASHYRVHQQGLVMDKGYLYSIERDLEENPIIVKYKL